MPVTVHVVDSTILLDARRFKRLGTVAPSDVVIQFGAMCNGNQQVISEITNRVGLAQIKKLIFYGHAGPGIMNTTAGKSPIGAGENSGFGATCRATDVCSANQWSALQPYFAPGACVILKGCNVAQGAIGRSLLLQLSQAFDVPVYGSDWYQATGVSYLVGNVIRATPDGTIVEDKSYKRTAGSGSCSRMTP